MIPIRCPQCGRGLQAQAEHHGRRARCRGCGTSFVVDCHREPTAPIVVVASAPEAPTPAPAADATAAPALTPVTAIDTERQQAIETQIREAEGRLERTQQEVSVALDELRIGRGEADAARAETARAEAETARARAEAAQARAEATGVQAEAAEARAHANQARAAAQSAGAQALASRAEAAAARAEAEAARTQVDSARQQAQAARAQADSARAEAEQSARQTTETIARLREQAGPLESARQRLAMLEEQVRLELLAATDMESRATAARRSLADAELSLVQEREALAAAERDRQEVVQIRTALAAQCELLRAEEAALRQSLVDLEAHAGRLSGELVAAEPRTAPAGGELVLPEAAGAMRVADWVGGLRGLDLGTVHGREFIERLAPLLDRHPDRRSLDEWARQGRTVFVLCDTPHEAGRLKQLIDVWGEVDPDGIAAIAPAFHGTTTLISAPSRVVRARRAAAGKPGRRRASARRGR